jgi:hypothetical protein
MGYAPTAHSEAVGKARSNADAAAFRWVSRNEVSSEVGCRRAFLCMRAHSLGLNL